MNKTLENYTIDEINLILDFLSDYETQHDNNDSLLKIQSNVLSYFYKKLEQEKGDIK